MRAIEDESSPSTPRHSLSEKVTTLSMTLGVSKIPYSWPSKPTRSLNSRLFPLSHALVIDLIICSSLNSPGFSLCIDICNEAYVDDDPHKSNSCDALTFDHAPCAMDMPIAEAKTLHAVRRVFS